MGVGEGFTPGQAGDCRLGGPGQAGRPATGTAGARGAPEMQRNVSQKARTDFRLPKAPALRHPRLFCGKSDGWGESAIS